MSKTGQVLQSEIVGSVKMRVRLTGMPELRLGLNDKVLFENTGSECFAIVYELVYNIYYNDTQCDLTFSVHCVKI